MLRPGPVSRRARREIFRIFLKQLGSGFRRFRVYGFRGKEEFSCIPFRPLPANTAPSPSTVSIYTDYMAKSLVGNIE